MTTFEPESNFLIGYGLPEKGVYVDLGASHPQNRSLTSFVRDAGWRGLAIDGNQDYAADWALAGFGNHFVCAVLSDQPHVRFVVHDNSFTSRISDTPETDHPERWGIKRVEDRSTIPLNHLLDVHEIGEIDLLTSDLEGHEFAVLQMLNWEKHRPKFVVSEYVTQGEGTDPRVCNMLIELGYEVIRMSASNLIFKRK